MNGNVGRDNNDRLLLLSTISEDYVINASGRLSCWTSLCRPSVTVIWINNNDPWRWWWQTKWINRVLRYIYACSPVFTRLIGEP